MNCLVRFYEAYLKLSTAVENLSFGEMPDEEQLVAVLVSLPFLRQEAENFKRQKGDLIPLYLPQTGTAPAEFAGVSKLDCHAYKKAWRIVAKATGKESYE